MYYAINEEKLEIQTYLEISSNNVIYFSQHSFSQTSTVMTCSTFLK